MTAVRASYVKHRRRLPPEALGEVEEAFAKMHDGTVLRSVVVL